MPRFEGPMGWRRVHMYDRAYYSFKTYWLMYSPCAPTVLYMSESVWVDAIGGGTRCAAVDFTTGRPVAFEAVMVSDYRFDSLRTKNPRPYDLTRWGVAAAFGAETRRDCPVATLARLVHQEMPEESAYDHAQI